MKKGSVLFIACAVVTAGCSSLPRYSDSTVSFEYPAGWEVNVPLAKNGWCQINAGWDHPINAQTPDWVSIQLLVLNREQMRLLSNPNQPIYSLEEYRRALTCQAPYSADILRPPLFDNESCAKYLATMTLSAAHAVGYMYENHPQGANNPGGRKTIRQRSVVFTPGEAPSWIYRVDYYALATQFKRHWPEFVRLLGSLRPTPGRAPFCGQGYLSSLICMRRLDGTGPEQCPERRGGPLERCASDLFAHNDSGPYPYSCVETCPSGTRPSTPGTFPYRGAKACIK